MSLGLLEMGSRSGLLEGGLEELKVVVDLIRFIEGKEGKEFKNCRED
jgi:hypothetical protein